LSNTFDPFYIVGAKLTWNFWDWKQQNREKQILGLQRQMIENQKQTIDKNLRVAIEQDKAGILKYEQLVEQDDEIISLRTRIVESAESQLFNGVITSTDYLTELNAEKQALLNREVHKIQLIKSKIDYLTQLGKQ